MPVVTSISPQKNGKRVNIYLDGRFSFGLDLDNLVKFAIKEGSELSQKEIGEIVKKAEFQKILDKLLLFSTLRPRSKKEVEIWLKRKKVHESIKKDLFDKLYRLELLDDYKFAVWWIEQRNSFKPRGKKGLIYELLQKGVEKETIEKAIAEVGIDEGKIAKSLMTKNLYKWERFDEKKAREKKIQFLLRKGFSWDVIKKVV